MPPCAPSAVSCRQQPRHNTRTTVASQPSCEGEGAGERTAGQHATNQEGTLCAHVRGSGTFQERLWHVSGAPSPFLTCVVRAVVRTHLANVVRFCFVCVQRVSDPLQTHIGHVRRQQRHCEDGRAAAPRRAADRVGRRADRRGHRGGQRGTGAADGRAGAPVRQEAAHTPHL